MPKISRFFALPKISHFLALPIMAGALAFSAWGQGATHPGMSMYAQPSYDGIERTALNPKTNAWETQRGWLMFDANDQVRFVSRSGSQTRIPYKGIKTMEYSFYSPVETAKTARHAAFNVKLGGKRYLTVRYETGSGLETSVLVLDPDVYQQVIGSFQSKTGTMVSRPGGFEKHW